MTKALFLPPSILIRGSEDEFLLSVITANGQLQTRSFRRAHSGDVADLTALHEAIGRWVGGEGVVP